ncbi:glutamate receptor ionotropic, NMDA 2A-like [Glandiceps talaboti]
MLVFLLLALRAIPLLASEAVKIGLVLSPTQSPHPRLHLQGKPHSNVQIDLVRLNVGAGNPYETIEYLRAEICDKEISGLIYAVSPDNIDTFLRYPIAAYVAMVAEKLGIPIITAVTSDLAQQSTGTNTSIFHIQASPEDIGHSMLKLLDHFGWNHATVITGSDPVSLNFATQMEYLIQEKTSWKKISVKTLDFNTDIKVDIMDLSDSYYSIFVIYASLAEAKEILLTARECNILRKGFVWIVAGSVMDSLTGKHIPDEFPTGLIGLKHRDLKYGLKERIDDALSSYLEAIVSYSNLGCKPLFLGPPGCESNTIEEVKWHSETCLNYQPQDIFSEFGENGYLLTPEIVVINTHENGYFKQVGVWQNNTLELESITWLGHSARSQQRMSGPGSDLKERLKVVTVEEVPFVNIIDAAEYSYEKCTTGMVCRIANTSDADYVEKCCGGYAMDLLKELSRKVDGGFEFDLYVRKHYGRYLESEQWNGVVGDLVYGRADSMVGGLKLSSQRQKVLDFSVPFMTSGVTVIVEQSRGNTPPKAVWDPFDFMVWIMALCVALITTSLIVFFFEWYSPTGYAMSVARPRGSHFTVGDSIWMTWALTFNNSLPHRVPKSFSGKFMGTVWAFYSLVFIALYTANLTAHMIKVEKKLPITGFMDPKIQNPQASYPPIKFATVNSTNTESLIATHNPRMHTYMKADLVETAEQGIEYLDSGKLDVFIYDTMVSEYLASRDRQCDLVTVDSAFAMTGYAIAFTKGSPWREKIDKALLQLSENGIQGPGEPIRVELCRFFSA